VVHLHRCENHFDPLLQYGFNVKLQIEIKRSPEGEWERFGPVWDDYESASDQAEKLWKASQHVTLTGKCSAMRVVEEGGRTVWQPT
jgi:hypothetical protein